MIDVDWRPELEVVMDEAIERGRMREVSNRECKAALYAGSMQCGVFYRQSVGPWGASEYDWSDVNGGDIETNGLWLHRDCPLWGCEFYWGQVSVPVAGPDPSLVYVPRWTSTVEDFYDLQPRRQHFRLVPRVDTPQARAWCDQVEAMMQPLVEREMERYHRRLVFGDVADMVVPDVRHMVRVANIDSTPKRLRGAEASVKQASRSKTPQHLLKQKSRLDGRR